MRTILSELYNLFVTYVVFVDWEIVIGNLKILSVFISIILVLAMLYLLFKIRKNVKMSLETAVEAITESQAEMKIAVDRDAWIKVMAKSESQNESDYRMAVVEADNLFDDFLKKLGFEGEDMGERLQIISRDQLPTIDDVWQAHKTRNRIVHESDFHLGSYQAKQAVKILKEAMEKLAGG